MVWVLELASESKDATCHFPQAAEMAEMGKTYSVVVDKELVIERVGELVKRQDLSKYVL